MRRLWKVGLMFVWTCLISSTINNISWWNWLNHDNMIWRRSWSFKKNENWTSDLTWWTNLNSKRESVSSSSIKFTMGTWSCFIMMIRKENSSPFAWSWSKRRYDMKTYSWIKSTQLSWICTTNGRLFRFWYPVSM